MRDENVTMSFLMSPVTCAAPVPGFDYDGIQGIGVSEAEDGKLAILVRHPDGTMLAAVLDDTASDTLCHLLAEHVERQNAQAMPTRTLQ